MSLLDLAQFVVLYLITKQLANLVLYSNLWLVNERWVFLEAVIDLLEQPLKQQIRHVNSKKKDWRTGHEC